MAQAGFPLPLDGGCRCGAIRYRVTGVPAFIFACHCTDCRQLTASAFSIGLAVSEDGFAVVGGEPHMWTKTADSGKLSHQYWCGVCHGWTHTVAEGSPGVVVVRASTLDDSDWVRPVGQIFLRSAYPWARLSVPLDYEEEFADTGPLRSAFARSRIRPKQADQARKGQSPTSKTAGGFMVSVPGEINSDTLKSRRSTWTLLQKTTTWPASAASNCLTIRC